MTKLLYPLTHSTICLLVLLLWAATSLSTMAQNIRFVKAGGTGDGTTWSTASGDLQAMINASGVRQVWVAGGRYLPANGKSFTMKQGVSVYGGFAGTESELKARPTVNPVTGSPSATTLTATPYNPIIYNSFNLTDTTDRLDGVVITGGIGGYGQFGGGLYNFNTDLTLANCLISGNTANVGSGVYSRSCLLVMINCVVSGNTGDGIICVYTNPTLTNCVISNNFGIGVATSNGDLTMTNCVVRNSLRSGLTNYNSKQIITNCLISGNGIGDANTFGSLGGGIMNSSQVNIKLINCTITGNRADKSAAIYNSDGSVQMSLVNCILWDNKEAEGRAINDIGGTANYCLFQAQNPRTFTSNTSLYGTNNLAVTQSPFVDGSDYQLTACSPAVNTGDPNSSIVTSGKTDLFGQPRFYQNGRIDIGAYEYQGMANVTAAITQQPASGTAVCVGGNVSTSVGSNGDAVSYQWYKDSRSQPVAGQTTATLRLTNVQQTDAGSYSVVVTGSCASSVVSNAFILTVNTPPLVSLQQNGPLNCARTSVTLTAGGGPSGGPFSYVFGPGASPTTEGNTASVLLTGSYSVTVTANNGCSASTTTTVESSGGPAAPILLSSATDSQEKPVTVTASGCSATVNWQVQGGTGIPNGATYTLSQPGNYTLTASCSVGNCVSPSSAPLALGIRSGGFSITAVDTRQCQLVDVSRGEYRVTFVPQYSSLDGGTISFRVINELDATNAPGPYSLRLYTDNPVVSLAASQGGGAEARFSYDWLAACTGSTNPTSGFTITGVTNLSCVAVTATERRVIFTPTYSGLDGTPVRFRVVNEIDATIDVGPYAIRLYTDNPVVKLEAVQAGVTASYRYAWLNSCSTPTSPITTNFAITGVTTVRCEAVTTSERRVTFTPTYAGTNGAAISLRVVNEVDATTAPGPYTIRLYTDNPAVTLEAIQEGQLATYRYEWLKVCNIGGRQGASETSSGLQVRVLGNPVIGESAEVEIRGVEGKPVQVQLADLMGHLVYQRQIQQAAVNERLSIPLGSSRLLVLRVSTPTQQQQLKLIRP